MENIFAIYDNNGNNSFHYGISGVSIGAYANVLLGLHVYADWVGLDKPSLLRLSPCYDINPPNMSEGLKLYISKDNNSQSLDLALNVAPHFRLSLSNTKSHIQEICKQVKYLILMDFINIIWFFFFSFLDGRLDFVP